MKRFVLDTSVILHYSRSNKIYQKIEEENQLTSQDVMILISVVTLGEPEGFVQRLNWNDDKKLRLKSLLDNALIIDISQNDQKLLAAFANLSNYSKNIHPTEKLGRAVGIGQNDLWIAALASVADATLLTNDGGFDHLSPKWIKLIKYESK